MQPVSLNSIKPIDFSKFPQPVDEVAANNFEPFVDLLTGQAEEVNGLQSDANGLIQDLLTGQEVNSVEVFSAVQKADMAFRMMQQIRNKLVDAYREINQMQI